MDIYMYEYAYQKGNIMEHCNDYVIVNGNYIHYAKFVEKLFKKDNYDAMLTHAALGIAGEAGEFVDAIKKLVIYGKALDTKNVIEELGDLLFYIQAAMNIMDVTAKQIRQANVDKLAKRYPTMSYSNAAAIERADKIANIDTKEGE